MIQWNASRNDSMKYKLINFAKQFGLFLLVVWTVVSLVTLLIEIVPGDPATANLPPDASSEQEALRGVGRFFLQATELLST